MVHYFLKGAISRAKHNGEIPPVSGEEIEDLDTCVAGSASAYNLGRDRALSVEAGNDMSIEELLCGRVTADGIVDDEEGHATCVFTENLVGCVVRAR